MDKTSHPRLQERSLESIAEEMRDLLEMFEELSLDVAYLIQMRQLPRLMALQAILIASSTMERVRRYEAEVRRRMRRPPAVD